MLNQLFSMFITKTTSQRFTLSLSSSLPYLWSLSDDRMVAAWSPKHNVFLFSVIRRNISHNFLIFTLFFNLHGFTQFNFVAFFFFRWVLTAFSSRYTRDTSAMRWKGKEWFSLLLMVSHCDAPLTFPWVFTLYEFRQSYSRARSICCLHLHGGNEYGEGVNT